jgi:Type II secretion system (T2SS), protein N
VKRGVGIALLAAVAFALIFLARMPAAWILPAGAAHSPCASIDGPLWSGTCTGLTVQGTPLGDVSWTLQPLKLLLGKLGAHVTFTQGAAQAAADVELGFGGQVTARHLVADLPLDPQLIPGVPQSLHGRTHLDIALAQFSHGVITQLAGRIEARDLEDRSGADTPLGSYVVVFPGGRGEPIGKLHDTAGPLALEGTLRLTPQPGFELQGLIAARQGAAPEVVNNLRFLGPPDASGRRQFSVTGSF